MKKEAMRIGIDVGGTKIAAGLVSKSGQVTFRKKIKTATEKGYPAVKDQVTGLVSALLTEASAEPRDIEGLGIACAGQLDRKTKKVIFSPNLKWTDAPLRQDVEATTGIRTVIENDVNAAAYGEWRFGFRKEGSDVVALYLGTGVGGGLILQGRLYRGSHGVGGEIGHITLNPDGYQCHCGNNGCFEAYCGGSYIEKRLKQHLAEGYRGKLWQIIEGRMEKATVTRLEEGTLLGDALCNRVWAEIVEYLGSALQSIANLLNPELIIVGGGVVTGTKRLLDEARLVMERRAMRASLAGLKVERARMGNDAPLLGAACLIDE